MDHDYSLKEYAYEWTDLGMWSYLGEWDWWRHHGEAVPVNNRHIEQGLMFVQGALPSEVWS